MSKEFNSDLDNFLASINERLRKLEEQGYATPEEILEVLDTKVIGCYDWPSGKEYLGE